MRTPNTQRTAETVVGDGKNKKNIAYIIYIYIYILRMRTPNTQRTAETVVGDGKNKKNIAPVPCDL
jgi:transposase-like protein